MQRRWRVGATGAIAAALMLTGLAGQAHAQSGQPVIASVDLNGVVDPIIADHIVSVIQRANDDRDAAVLLTIDTPGGLGSSMDEIDEAILNSAVPVIGYVAPSGARAASAGAFVLMSSPVAAMAPGTNVGASTPIGLSGGDLLRQGHERRRREHAETRTDLRSQRRRRRDLRDRPRRASPPRRRSRRT